jgi:hypothetical protein
VSLIRGTALFGAVSPVPPQLSGGNDYPVAVTSPADPSPLTPAAPPVFGRAADRAEPVKTDRFGLEVEYRKGGKKVREAVYFTCYLSLDAGAVLRMMQAGDNEQAVAQAVAFVLATALVDDDGVPVEWRTPDEDDYIVEDPEEEGSPAVRGEPTEDEPDGALLYERWDGQQVPWDDLAFDELTDGSSRRRFAVIMASARHRVDLDALVGVQKWLVERSTNRPTRRSAPSGRGPRSTTRGSAGRSR